MAASFACIASMFSQECELSKSRILSQSAFANSQTILVMVVCSGTLNVSSAVTSLWSAIAGNTVAVAPGMFVSTRSRRCSSLVGALTICFSPTSSHAAFIAVPSALFELECCNHLSLWTLRSPRTIVPIEMPSNEFNSVLNVSIVATSPAAGGRYHTPTSCGPCCAWTRSQKRSAFCELSTKVIRSAMFVKAKAAIPPHFRPSDLSRRAINVYPSRMMCSTVRSRNVSFTQIKSGRSCI